MFHIRHGDMLYLSGGGSGEDASTSTASAASASAMGMFGEAGVNGQEKASDLTAALRSREPSMVVIEDEVDQVLDKLDGRIERQRNEQL